MSNIKDLLDTIIQGDCLEVMKEIPDESVDLVLTDPPYGVLGKIQKWDDINVKEFTKKWWDLVKNKLKLNSSTYVFWSQTYLLEGLQIFQPNRVLIWHHPNLATPTNKMFLWTYDPILYIKFGKPIFQPSFAEKENVDVFKFAKPQSNWKGENKGLHPASKPIKLIMNFVKISSNKNDLVLDPFLGAGTTAIACKKLGRHFIGIELNPEYVEMANRRLNFKMLDFGEKDEIL